MKLKVIDFAIFIALTVCIIATVSFENTCEDIRQEVLRLHVIANSDKAYDQSLKLNVRDAVLTKGEDIFVGCEDIISAKGRVNSSMRTLWQIAQRAVYDNGYNYDVRVSLDKSYFPTRVYENITLPAGYYNAVKIVIGEGKGKNWWCVMFPPMCMPAATKKEDILGSVLGEKEMEIVTSKPEYEVRFWLIEKYYELKNKLSSQK